LCCQRRNKYSCLVLSVQKQLKLTCAALSIYRSYTHAQNHVKLHYFCKTLCCITTTGNTVQQRQRGKQAKGDKLCTVYSAKQLRNPAKLQIILTKYCQNSATFVSKSGGLGACGLPGSATYACNEYDAIMFMRECPVKHMKRLTS